MILAVNAESFVGCSLGEATAALATASAAAPSPANVLAVSPAEEAAARRVMSLPRPDKKSKKAVSREINCDLEGEPSVFEDFIVELEKKPGRGLGISVVGRRDGPGVFVSDMVSEVSGIAGFDFLSTSCRCTKLHIILISVRGDTSG